MHDEGLTFQRDQLQAEVERLEHERETLLEAPVASNPRQLIEHMRQNRHELEARLVRLRGAGTDSG